MSKRIKKHILINLNKIDTLKRLQQLRWQISHELYCTFAISKYTFYQNCLDSVLNFKAYNQLSVIVNIHFA